jgi:hypothetical protein
MKKYLVYAMCISTGGIDKKVINDVSIDGQNILHYLANTVDADTIWRIYGPDTPESEADAKFIEYVERCGYVARFIF